MFYEWLFLAIGLCCLLGGAELFIRGSTSIALLLGVSTLIIGLTVVGFGTSAAELFVSVRAAIIDSADIAIGNIIGSNIFNILVIVGLAALFKPLALSGGVLKREMPIMLFVVALFYYMASDLTISRLEGLVLLGGITLYIFLNYMVGRRESIERKSVAATDGLPQEPSYSLLVSCVFVLLGLGLMVLGSKFSVDSAVVIAQQLGVSELLIGITLVAVGTSLPELATTIVAAVRKEPDLVVGGAIGSNIFNVLCVIGATATLNPLAVNGASLSLDFPFMFCACLVVWPCMLYGRRLSRLEGGLMIGAYLVYISILMVTQFNVS